MRNCKGFQHSVPYLDVADEFLGLVVGVWGERFEGVQDGPVAGAAAEVAVHGLLDLLRRHRAARLEQAGGDTTYMSGPGHTAQDVCQSPTQD